MKDAVLSKYLPNKEQLSGKLPEREFFFGVTQNPYISSVSVFTI